MTELAVPAVMMAAAPSGVQWDMRTGDGSVRMLKPVAVLRLSSLLMVRDAVLQGWAPRSCPGCWSSMMYRRDD